MVRPPPPAYSQGLVCITGGLGSLGRIIANWLAGREIQHMELLSRTGRLTADAAAVLLDRQSSLCSAQVTISGCDVASKEDVKAMFAGRPGKAEPQLLGVVHAGGVLADGELFTRVISDSS